MPAIQPSRRPAMQRVGEFFATFEITDYLGPPAVENQRFDCALGTNPFLDDGVVRAALEEAAWVVNDYEFVAYDRLRHRLVEYWTPTAPQLTRANIEFGAGTFGLMRQTCGFALDSGGTALGYAPQFPRIESEVWLRRARYEAVSFGTTYRFDADRLAGAITAETDLVYLDNPNNPTGQVVPPSVIAQIAERARRTGAIVLVDEAYGDYLDESESAISLVSAHDNLAVIRSASKFWGLPNHRVGYVVADAGLIDVYTKTADPFPFTGFSARVFMAMLARRDEASTWRAQVGQAKARLMAALPASLPTHPATPILTVPLAASTLARHGIAAEGCGVNRGLGPGFSRLRLCADVDGLIAELQAVPAEARGR